MSIISLGIDVGNDSTKSDHTTIISGYNESQAVPITGENSCLYMDGTYYTFKSEPFPYNEDKTDRNRCVILSLMSLAEEIIYTISHGGNDNLSKEQIQAEIDKYTEIDLGVGLPVSQYPILKDKTEKCYRDFFINPVSFRYNGYEFKNLTLRDIAIYVQGFALASCGYASDILMGRKGCPIIIDNGGITIDLIFFNPKDYVDVPTKSGQSRRIYRPDTSACVSLTLGSHKMYDYLSREVKRITGLDLEGSDIEAVLKNEPHVIPDSVVLKIRELCQIWVNEKVIDECKQNGVAFQTRPVVFMGGTNVLLKEYIEKNPLVGVHEFITDARANARGYTNLLRQKNAKR